MREYDKLIVEKYLLNKAIAKEKKVQHKLFILENTKKFKLLDFLVMLCIVFNFSALFTTNLLVVKDEIDAGYNITFAEVNPVTADVHNLELHPNYKEIIISLAIQSMFWLVLLVIYIYVRLTVFTFPQLITLFCIVTMYFILYGLDFFSNLGLLIGVTCF